MPYMSFVNDETGIRSVIDYKPDTYVLFLQMLDKLVQGPSDLSVMQREMIAAYVSGLNQCQFCFGSHAAFAEAFGLDVALFDQLLADIDTAPVEDKLKPLFRYVKKLTEAPARLTEGEAKAVYDAGWSEDALSDAIGVAGIFAFANRIVEGHGINGDSVDAYRSLAQLIKAEGYVRHREVT